MEETFSFLLSWNEYVRVLTIYEMKFGSTSTLHICTCMDSKHVMFALKHLLYAQANSFLFIYWRTIVSEEWP